MQTVRVIFAFVVLTLSWCVSASAQERSIQLLTPQVGWAFVGGRLFWTSNAGSQWQDITPPTTSPGEVIGSVFFLDTSTGWALLTYEDAATGEARFDLASTIDAGANWSITPVNIPPIDPAIAPFSGGGEINFVDSLCGWMNLDVASSSAFNLGALLQTTDGGNTWNWAPGDPGASASIRFVTSNDGWMAGGPGGQHVYVTHDGSSSWQELSLLPPPQVDPNSVAIYDLPVFQDSQNGFLPVTYSVPDGTALALGLFATGDGGQTWNANRVLTNLPNTYVGIPMPSAVINSTWITVVISSPTLTLITVAPDGTTTNVSATVVFPSYGPGSTELSFVSLTHGWVLEVGKLLSTTDGGTTWTDITPPGGGQSPATASWASSHPNSVASKPAWSGAGWWPDWVDTTAFKAEIAPTTSFAPEAAPTHTSVHLGFDMCEAQAPGLMQTWWNSTPFFDVGIYIGGNSRTCRNRLVDSTWVIQVTNQGWGLIPIWSGPQAPCTGFRQRFSSDTDQARLDGTNEANSATSAASTLGLAGTIIYYDIEYYNLAPQCSAAVTAFMSGWVSRLHANGFLAGVYGNPLPAQRDFSQASPLPDAVWIAKYLSFPQITIWGLNPLCDPYSGPPCNSSFWTSNQRIHQFVRNKTVKKMTQGKVRFKIDPDIEDAPVAGGQGTKSYNFTFSGFDIPMLTITAVSGINNNHLENDGQIVGYVLELSGPEHGFLYDAGTVSTFDCPGATATRAFGINDAGHIVGDCDGEHGFLKTPAGFTTFDYPGMTIETRAFGINDADHIIGNYTASGTHGFLKTAAGFTSFDYPGAHGTAPRGINGADHIVGGYMNSGGDQHGFLYKDGTFSAINYPGAVYTFALGINDNDQIVGVYSIMLPGPQHGFLYDARTGAFTTIDYPGASDTNAAGINDNVQILGSYVDPSTHLSHFLLATPQ